MKNHGETFDEEISKFLSPENILPELIRKGLEKIGIELTEGQIAKLKSQLAGFENDSIQIEFEDDQIVKAGFKDKEHFQNVWGGLSEGLISNVNKMIDDLTRIMQLAFFYDPNSTALQLESL